MTVENFNADRIIGVLAQHGITKAEPSDPGLSGGPMKVRVSRARPGNGGANDGTPELYLGDPDGLVVQLQDTTYCGGAGALGNVCPQAGAGAEEGAPRGQGSQSLHDQRVGWRPVPTRSIRSSSVCPIRSRQGAALGLGVGPGVMFLMFAGGGRRPRRNAAPRPASINHVCMNMEKFNPDDMLKTLAAYGISPRGDAPGPAGPMKSYISLRMENRGGAPGGTPELYFTDPDGLLIQLQDVSYCGGAGFLGNVCEG